jgi:glutamate-ammonia-ligase adenylyltransferase
MPPAFTTIAFQDAARAEANLAQLEKLLPTSLHYPLASLLAQSPDPDGALNLLERYASKAPTDILADLARYPSALTYLIAIFGYSGFLAETFLAEPHLPVQFARDKNFTKLRSKEDVMQDYARFSTAAPNPWLSAQLGQFKRRIYLRIALKDVLGMSTLAETTLELSELADVIVTNALIYCDQELRKRYGEPQYRDAQGRIARSEFSVISLGKMGGNELNYSSDIDLLFLYSHDGETSGGNEPDSIISNKEYFVRLANAITRTITQSTPYGQVFRVDLRLRPEGDQGDMTISLRSALEYYEHRARDWELQMLIKARHSAGDERLTREFLRGVEPYIYSSPMDFEAIETVLFTRERLSRKLKEARAGGIDVKRHRGGIRDIEFLTQCLQRLHGGHDPWVRSGGTLLALRKLNDKGWLSDRDYASLTGAYEFLRKVEHLIQLDRGQQTHRLPADPEALDRLARRVGLKGRAWATRSNDVAEPLHPGAILTAQLQETFKRVDEIYQKVIHPRAARQPSGEVYALKAPLPLLEDRVALSYKEAVSFLSAQCPGLAECVQQASVPERAQKNATRFLSNLFSSSERFELAERHPEQLRLALELISASDYLAELLIHHPEDMLALDSAATPPADPHPDQLHIQLEGAPGDDMVSAWRAGTSPFLWMLDSGWDIRQLMALLRRHYRAQKLVLSSRDWAAMDSIFSALKNWSALGIRMISTACHMVCGPLSGGPDPTQALASIPFAILGLGRLGLLEFDLASDADLIFVVPSGTSEQDIEFWARRAEKVIEVLSSYTSDGALFAVDTRLRPLGQEGELVVTEGRLLDYLDETAKVWEGLTYLKISPVAGNTAFGQVVAEHALQRILSRFSSFPDLESDLQQMRRRLERELASSPTDPKSAPGGYYDIDYALSYLRLRHRVNLPPASNTPEQIRMLASLGILRSEDAATLNAGARFLRSVDHAIRMVTGKSAPGLPDHVGHAALVEELARRWGLLEDRQQNLVRRMHEVQQEIRYVYRRVVGSE